MKRLLAAPMVALGLILAASVAARAETVDEIVAKINDDIVTKSDLDTEEQGILQELYRRYSGPELDKKVAEAKRTLLRHLIDQKVLVQRAGHLFDMTKMQDFYVEQFKLQQDIKSDKELEKLLKEQGMTMADLKQKLVDVSAPEQVIRAEVLERIAIPEKEERDYYDAHLGDFTVPAQATVREIVVKANEANREVKKEAAEAIRTRAAAPGADFSAIATEVSESGTKKNGGLLGTVKKGDLSAGLDKVAFSLPVGDVSPVIEMEYGFHIVKVESRTEDVVKPFNDVRNQIEEKLQGNRRGAEYTTYMKKAWGEATIWIAPKYQNRLSPLDAETDDATN